MPHPGRCAKQTTYAIIANGYNVFMGTNWCENPQAVCPRMGMGTGQGYHLCREVCRQPNHAEVDVCLKAGKRARGGTLYLFGHYYFCDSCVETIKKYGLKSWEIVKPMPKDGKV